MERQYIGARYVPKFFDNELHTPEWRPNVQYEPLTIVTYVGNSYTSKKPVPANIGSPDENPLFWASTGNYSAQVEEYREEVASYHEDVTEYIDKLDDIIGNWSHIIKVGAHCEYTSVVDAVTYAKTICTKTDRVLILIMAGTYSGSVDLCPNPGIDMIGLGDVIITATSSYPHAALYTNSDGYFENIQFSCTLSGTYGVHIEHEGSDSTGQTIFVNCTFIATQNSAVGVGMTNGGLLYFKNCRFYSNHNYEESAGLYIHNLHTNGANKQYAYCYDCIFEGTTNGYDLRIADSFASLGDTGTSVLHLTMSNCVLKRNRVVFNLGVNDYSHHYLTGNSNIEFDDCSKNNSAVQLNKDTLTGATYSINVPVSSEHTIAIPTPLFVNSKYWSIESAKYRVDGVEKTLNTTPDVVSSYHYAWTVDSGDSGKPAIVSITCRPK